MKLMKIDDNFSTSPQINTGDLNEIKTAGFRSLICNRPDNEDGGAHPDHNLLESAAKELGLEFAYVPVVPGQINDAQIARFKLAIDKLPGPILGYCRLGIRSKVLYERSR
jgi:sulfide:quinone oxidoreductase